MRRPDSHRLSYRRARGVTMIEVLIAIVIVAIGLLGLGALQVGSVNTQMEAYQRTQAVFLIEDMANRIRVNATAARDGAYTVGTSYGLLEPENCAAKGTTADRDLCEWNIALSGASVSLDGENIGSMIGAQACLENVAGSVDGETIIRLTVAWQGMSPTVAPATACGQNGFGEDDRYRRTASVDTVLANLAL